MKTQSPQGEIPPKSGSPPPSDASDADGKPTPADSAQSLRDALTRLAEVKEYASYYLSTRVDRLKLQVDTKLFTVFISFVGILAIGAVIVVAVVLLMTGIASAIGGALGNRIWLGQLIVALGMLIGIPVVARVLIAMLLNASRKKTVEKYESRKLEQARRASDTMSPNEPKNQSDDKGADSAAELPPEAVSEAIYLREQAAEAKAAIVSALDDLKADLGHGIDPRVWMQTHPWITLASVAAAGFATAAAVVPDKEARALRKLAAIEEALDAAHGVKRNGNGHGAPPAAAGGILALLLREVIGAVKPILFTVVKAAMEPAEKSAEESAAKDSDDSASPDTSASG